MKKNAKLIAVVLTLSRLGIGPAVAVLLYQGRIAWAFGLYVFGLMTDVLDGTIARHYQVESSRGAELDRRADMFFNASATVGYCLGAYLKWGTLWWAIGPFIATAGLVVVTRPFFQPHSAASKLRSGVIRVILIGFLVARLPFTIPTIVMVAALIAFAIPAALHEWEVTKEEVRTGKRRWFKRPLPQAA